MRAAYQISGASGSITVDNRLVHGVPFEAPAESGVIVQGFLERGAGARLYYLMRSPLGLELPEPRARVLLLHGYGEHCHRYDEFCGYLLERGYEVWRFDARGHGQSSGQRGHVADYREYVEDAVAVAALVGGREPRLPLLVMGHSNGALTAIRAVEEGLLEPAALIVTNPLMALRRKPVPDALARILSRLAPRLPLPNGVRARQVTHDPAIIAALEADRRVHRVATPRWYWSMTLATRQALAEAERLSLPLLTVVSELDPLVDPAAVCAFHERAGSSDKRLLVREGAYHEPLNELDRVSLFALVADWMDGVLSSAQRSVARAHGP